MARKAIPSQGHGHGEHQQHAHRQKDGPGRLWPYVYPWFIWLMMMTVAALGRWLWGSNPVAAPWYSAGVETATLGGLWLCFKMTKNLHEVLRILACFTTVVVGMFVFIVGILGLNAVMWSLWGGVGFVVCMYWNMRRMLLPAYEKGQRDASPMAQRLIDALGGAQLGQPKREVIEGHSEEQGPIRVPLTVNRGQQTLDELKHMPEVTETIGKLRPGAARIERDPDDAGKAELVINPVDLLRGGTPWRGPSAFGESISLPVPVGRYASTKLANIFMVGDESEGRNLVQWLIMGMTGAGKSQFMRMLAADLSTRKKVTIWAHDHVKGLQTLKPLIEGGALDWVTMTKADGKAMLATTKNVIAARARWLGIKGFDQWTDDCGLNVLIVWIEEANALAQLKDLLDLVREGRSVGVIIMLSLQRASHTTIDTDTRAQLAGNVCFGVESDVDAKFGLPAHVLDAGAEPERWRADKPGYCYIAGPGISENQQAEEARTFFAKKEEIVDACLRGKSVRTPLADETDKVTIAAAGNVYMKRVPPEAFLNPQHPLFARGMGMSIKVGRDTTDGEDMDNGDDEETAVASSKNAGPTGVGSTRAGTSNYGVDDSDDDDDDDALDTSAQEAELERESDIPECPEPDLGSGKPREYKWQDMTKDEQTVMCRQAVQEYLKACDADGKAFVAVPDIHKMKPPIPRGREWIRGELKRLAGEIEDETPSPEGFRLERDEHADAGTFRIVPPAYVGASVGGSA